MTSILLEEWRDVPGFEGSYQVSNFGRVRSVTRKIIDGLQRHRREEGILMKLQVHTKGYLHIHLRNRQGKTKFFVHRLVAQVFIPNPEDKLFVNHKDKDRKNNHILNLEWCTLEENTHHRDNYNPDEPF